MNEHDYYPLILKRLQEGHSKDDIMKEIAAEINTVFRENIHKSVFALDYDNGYTGKPFSGSAKLYNRVLTAFYNIIINKPTADDYTIALLTIIYNAYADNEIKEIFNTIDLEDRKVLRLYSEAFNKIIKADNFQISYMPDILTKFYCSE